MLAKLIKMKNKKGFTLVELIVVIAIIGVLTAVLVPMMGDYLTKAKVSGMDTLAKSIKDTITVKSQEMDAKSLGLAPSGAEGTIVGVKAASEDGTGKLKVITLPAQSSFLVATNFKGAAAKNPHLLFAKLIEDELTSSLREQKNTLYFVAEFKAGIVQRVKVSEEATVGGTITDPTTAVTNLTFTKEGIADEVGSSPIKTGLITGSAPKWEVSAITTP